MLGILTGMAWSLLGLNSPLIMEKTVSSLAGVAHAPGPDGHGCVLTSGRHPESQGQLRSQRHKAGASLRRIPSGRSSLGVPDAAGGDSVMLGSAATVSCFVMARNMGHEGVLSSSVVAITTCGSAFTLTLGWTSSVPWG